MMHRATVLLTAGDRAAAEAMLSELRRRWPGWPGELGRRLEAAAFNGAFEEAYRLLAEFPESQKHERESWKLAIDALKMRTPEASAKVASICALQNARITGTVRLCLEATAALGMIDLAVELADEYLPSIVASKGVSADEAWMRSPDAASLVPVLYMPWMSKLRADPRIIAVFERMGLLDYWQDTRNWPDFCETEPQSVCARMTNSRPR